MISLKLITKVNYKNIRIEGAISVLCMDMDISSVTFAIIVYLGHLVCQ